ncbi:MAG TPA: DUF2461 domain-containing protein [Chitinophagaceae bacterium]|nr:DUF2461 domain-containing protein [Chitinophagaceae bacterium]MCC6634084.1 DUF2461 domain-containing protein [Chitinophagaceae bacterium]HNE94122.1 DUF2461 domain-containing protein [Chitinophagaceae bacterium]HNJ58775.1 DUF2461 domain-containing protein [Chitinophagaceae bacterium]HNM33538.1 DUF2461 domain-containing protein [Chitinophagaceae bacterium]
MLQKNTLQFLSSLKNNNNKIWFDANRGWYDETKADFINLNEAIIKKLKKKDTTLEPLIAKNCIFRINRDVRFSPNKTPYKTNMGASINKGGKKIANAGYYLHIEPGASFLAGGIWMPKTIELKKIRQEIDYNFLEFNKIVASQKIIQQFGGIDKSKEYVLTRPPKGYDIDNPAIEYLKFKSYIVSKNILDEELLKENCIQNIVSNFETITPLIYFINKAIED